MDSVVHVTSDDATTEKDVVINSDNHVVDHEKDHPEISEYTNQNKSSINIDNTSQSSNISDKHCSDLYENFTEIVETMPQTEESQKHNNEQNIKISDTQNWVIGSVIQNVPESTSKNSPGSTCQSSFIGPILPESTYTNPESTSQSLFIGPVIPNEIKGKYQYESEHLASEKVETCTKNSAEIQQIHFATNKDLDSITDEPVNKRMRCIESSQELDEMCRPIFEDSSFDLSNKEQTDTVPKYRGENQCSRSFGDMSVIHNPVFVTKSLSEFQSPAQDNYLRGCKWAPDGTCLLTNSNDNKLRLFDLPPPLYEEKIQDIPEMTSVIKIKECDTIYDYCWYPQMTSRKPETSCFVSSCKDNPVHLWDAFTGQLRCSYRPYNHVDELSSTYSLSFSCNGQKLYCGSNKTIRVFDVDKPGRDCTEILTYSKHFGQSGIISCIIPNPNDSRIIAAGSFNRSIALYNHEAKNMLCMFEGQQGGVTHMVFSPDGTKLYSGGRKDPEIICWDMRNPGQILFVALRQVETNQRMYFELDRSGKYLISGNQDGKVCIWDTTKPPVQKLKDSDVVLEPVLTYKAHNDTVNGVSFNPVYPAIATSSGQRHYPELGDSDDSDTDILSCSKQAVDNSVKLWWLT